MFWTKRISDEWLVMRYSLPRNLYNAAFWAAVLYGLYMQRHLYETWDNQLRPKIHDYATVLFLVVGAAVFILLNYVREAIANSVTGLYVRATGKQALNYEKGNYAKNLVKSARKLARRGDHAAAAEVFETLEDWEAAADSYEKAAEYSKAAVACIRFGDVTRALNLFEVDGDFESAADLANKEGLRECAQRYFRLGAEKAQNQNRFQRAAELYERAGNHERAGQLFETVQKPEDALRCYDKGSSAEAIMRIFQSVDAVQLARRGAESAELVRRCAETAANNGMKVEAATVLQAIDDHLRAAEIFASAEEWEKAGEAYLAAGKVEKATSTFARTTDTAKAAEFQGRVATMTGDWAAAGRHYEAAGKYNQAVDAYKRARDFHAAARVYETMKRYIMAAEMYSSAKDFMAAAAAYAKAPDWRNAAECFETAGDLNQAVGAYVNAGLYLRAGILALRLGDSPAAIDYLQRVAPTSPDSKIANAHLASAFFMSGRREMARDLFLRVQDQIPVNRETVPIFYSWGKLLEEDRSAAEAVSVYRRIMGVDVAYEDVPQRVARLEEEVSRTATGAGFGTGPLVAAQGRRPDTAHSTEFYARPTISGIPTQVSVSGMPTVRTRMPTETLDAEKPAEGPWKPETQAPETRFGDEGRYQIIKELGRGGMAIVYKALDQHLEREVALKTFPLSRNAGPGRDEVFLNEARMVARLSHPNIVTIYDSGHMNFLYYIAMEFVDGENLKQRVKRKGPMEPEETLGVLKQVSDALEYAHSHSVLHLDVKPGNIIVRPGGQVKVVDFGLSKILSDAATSTPVDDDSQRTLVGTPQYMAPEQILGEMVDPRTDVYSLGLTMFYLLTGRTPFEIKKVTDPLAISRMQVNAAFPRPSTLNATLPSRIDEVFVRCTQKNPSDRYQSVGDFINDLNHSYSG